jgi:hypothetical protein
MLDIAAPSLQVVASVPFFFPFFVERCGALLDLMHRGTLRLATPPG